MSKLLILDNYDSFTYNLVHYFEELLQEEVSIFRNDEITLDEVNSYSRIVLSPGPNLPDQAGILLPLIKRYAATKPILGVCLGHQALAVAYGGKLKQLNEVMHGLQRNCNLINESKLFISVEQKFVAGRYHSWVVDKNTLPENFKITAIDDDGEIMAMEHLSLPLYGVQFHPESIMTPDGKLMLRNWLEITK